MKVLSEKGKHKLIDLITKLIDEYWKFDSEIYTFSIPKQYEFYLPLKFTHKEVQIFVRKGGVHNNDGDDIFVNIFYGHF